MNDNPAESSEFSEEQDASVPLSQTAFSEAVLHSSDWTVETIVAQLQRDNIDINPRFQRRDAWDKSKKSRFIESIILGLPIPQIVLAERKGQRGRYIVLDGKQRLLSLLQYTGNAQVDGNAFALSGLEARTDLTRKRFKDLQSDVTLQDDLNAFLNYTIRAVVIRNWPDVAFLHLVFLRLNTGSVKLSPQELRQALFPGEFSNFVDDASAESRGLQLLLGRKSPDPRMRDVELLVRFLAFHFFLNDYRGRMKDFLDNTSDKLNSRWDDREADIRAAVAAFEGATLASIEVFGTGGVARKPGSRSFNRAIFDTLVFYASDERIRTAIGRNSDEVRRIYDETVSLNRFADAVESDTAGIPNTYARFAIWGKRLREVLELDFQIPELVDGKIRFNGFWD